MSPLISYGVFLQMLEKNGWPETDIHQWVMHAYMERLSWESYTWFMDNVLTIAAKMCTFLETTSRHEGGIAFVFLRARRLLNRAVMVTSFGD